MGRAITNKELEEIDEIMKEEGSSRHEIAEHLKDMRNFNPNPKKKEEKENKEEKEVLQGVCPSELPEIKAQQRKNELRLR